MVGVPAEPHGNRRPSHRHHLRRLMETIPMVQRLSHASHTQLKKKYYSVLDLDPDALDLAQLGYVEPCRPIIYVSLDHPGVYLSCRQLCFRNSHTPPTQHAVLTNFGPRSSIF